MKHGEGVYVFSDGGKYVGSFSQGVPSGRGVRIFSSSKKYHKNIILFSLIFVAKLCFLLCN